MKTQWFYVFLGELGGSNGLCSGKVFLKESQGQGPGLVRGGFIVSGTVIAVESVARLRKFHIHEILVRRPQGVRNGFHIFGGNAFVLPTPKKQEGTLLV